MNDRIGSKPEVSDGHENVRSWVTSGRGVEVVGTSLLSHKRTLAAPRGRSKPANGDAGGESRLQHQEQT